MAELTPRQADILAFIQQSIQERGHPPTLREIGAQMGLRTTSSANDHLRTLERKGYLTRVQPAASVDASSESSDTNSNRDLCFLSYSREDRPYLDRLLIHMRPLIRSSLIKTWSDKDIVPGDNWRSQISAALQRTKVAILLVSADFLASDFVVNNELPPLLDAAEKGGTRVIPLVIKPCLFTRDKRLSAFQAINDPNRPLLSMTEYERELTYVKVVELLDLYLRGADATDI